MKIMAFVGGWILLASLGNLGAQVPDLPGLPVRFAHKGLSPVKGERPVASLLPRGIGTGPALPGNPFCRQLEYQGIPIAGAFISSRLLGADRVRHSFPVFPEAAFPQLIPDPQPGKSRVWVWSGVHWACLFADTLREGPGKQEIRYRDASGDILFREDWELRYQPSGPDTSFRAGVFRPDPVSRLRIPYGGQLRDRGDSNSVLLSQARDTVRVKAVWENGRFQLKNGRFLMGEFSPPIRPRAQFSQADSFWLSRDRPEFEEVHAFYHLNAFRHFIDSLGFEAMADSPLPVDAHGMDGADQSAFSPLQNVLAFGEGNVDDAEDAAVVIHEYGHVLAHASFPFGNSGFERRSLEEGFCDYLAGSYACSLSDYAWTSLFKWDGHNEFWSGRSWLSSKVYPDNLIGQIHRDGEIFCAALTQAELVLGRALVHRILLKSLPWFQPQLTMPQAAAILLETDSLFFEGDGYAVLDQAFRSRGIEPGSVIVSNLPSAGAASLSLFHRTDLQGGAWEVVNPDGEAAEIFITDLKGRLLQSVDVPPGRLRYVLPTGNLTPGAYRIRVNTPSGTTFFSGMRFP